MLYYQTWIDGRSALVKVTMWRNGEGNKTTTMAWPVEGERRAASLASVRKEVAALRRMGYVPFLRGRAGR